MDGKNSISDILGSDGGWVLTVFAVAGTVLAFLAFGWPGVIALAFFLLILAVVVLARAAFTRRPAPGMGGVGQEAEEIPEEEGVGRSAAPSAAGAGAGDLEEQAAVSEPVEGESDDPGEEEDSAAAALHRGLTAVINRDPITASQEIDVWVAEAGGQEAAIRRALKEFYLVQAGDGEALRRLETLADENPTVAEVQRHFAHALFNAGSYRSSADELATRVQHIENQGDRARLKLAEARARFKLVELEAVTRLASEVITSPDEVVVADGHALLADVAKAREDAFGRVVHLSRAVAVNPVEDTIRFNLAYAASEAGFKDVALFHYDHLARSDGPSAAFNNLGVILEGADAPSLAVNYYVRALERGSSLAAGNLAARASRAGFLDEAIGFAQRGEELTPVSSKVGEAQKAIAQQREGDEATRKSLVAAGAIAWDMLTTKGIPSDTDVPVGQWLIDGEDWTFVATDSGSRGTNVRNSGSFVFMVEHGLPVFDHKAFQAAPVVKGVRIKTGTETWCLLFKSGSDGLSKTMSMVKQLPA